MISVTHQLALRGYSIVQCEYKIYQYHIVNIKSNTIIDLTFQSDKTIKINEYGAQ